MLNVALLSKWHVHASYYGRFVQESEDARVSCVWDDDPARGEAWAKELEVDFEPDLDKLLARKDVDAVLVDAPTNMHKEVMLKAAKAGKHIFTEKVMCLHAADCDEVIEAIEANKIIFTISFTQRCDPRMMFVKQAVDSGLIGDVTVLRVRNCHDGALAGWLPDYWYDPETTGGGAMMDLGAHPMYLSSWILGKPRRIQSMFNARTPHPVEDNSVCTIEFENGAIAIVETSLVSPMTPSIIEAYGTNGVILVSNSDVKIQTRDTAKLVEGGWVTPKLPEGQSTPLRQWMDAILYGGPVRFDAHEARKLTELMEKAYIADNTHSEQTF